jgi:hypothetical protein
MSDESQFHDRSVLITSAFQTDGGKEFLKVIEERKQGCLERIAKSESGIEIGAVENKPGGITIVVLNKDELQHELTFWKRLEGSFKTWHEEAHKPAEPSEEK